MDKLTTESKPEESLQIDFSDEQAEQLLAFLSRVEFYGEEALPLSRLIGLIENNPNNTWQQSDINNLMVALRKTSGIGTESVIWADLYVRLSDLVNPKQISMGKD